MAEKVSIFAEDAPSPFGHFAQAIKYGNTFYLSGQLPLDPATSKPVGGDIKQQTRQVFQNMTAIMQACGGQLSHVFSMTVYLLDLRDYPGFNEVSKEFFFFIPPAQTVVMVSGLPGGSRVCVSAQGEMKPAEMKGGML